MAKTANSNTNRKTIAFIDDMLSFGTASLVSIAELPEEVAAHVINHVALELCKNWGGSQLYVPMFETVNMHQRDLEVYEKFNGFNHHELSKEFHLSTITIYQIIARVRATMPKDQYDLFEQNQT